MTRETWPALRPALRRRSAATTALPPDRRALATLATLGLALSSATVCAQGTTLLSSGLAGEIPDCGEPTGPMQFCYGVHPHVSPDGRHVAYSSNALNLVLGASTPQPQVIRHDRQTCRNIRVSESPAGEPANQPAIAPVMSVDGNVVAFTSKATNLVTGLEASRDHVYVSDLTAGRLDLVSRSNAGEPGNGLSDGPVMSGDGRWIAFHSLATNLIADDANGVLDVFIHDRETGSVTLASRNALGEVGNGLSRRPAFSADGRFLAFESTASNLDPRATGAQIQIFLLDRDADGNGHFDEPGGTTLQAISVTAGGQPGNGHSQIASVSGDGRFVSYGSSASNLVTGDSNGFADIFLYDRQAGTTTRESLGPGGAQLNGTSYPPASLSHDGRFLSFHSAAPGLVAEAHNGVTHIVRRDVQTGANIIVSRNGDGAFANRSSEIGMLTGSGDTVVFASIASNLWPGMAANVGSWIYARDFSAAPYTCGQFRFDDPELALGEIEVGTTSPVRTIDLVNLGDAPLTGIIFSIPGQGFTVDTSACGDTLAPGARCAIGVSFGATVGGSVEGLLQAESAQGLLALLAISATGVVPDYEPALDYKIVLGDGGAILVGATPVTFEVSVPDTGGRIVGFSFSGSFFVNQSGFPGFARQTQLTVTTPQGATYVVGGVPPTGTPWDFQKATGSNHVLYRHGIGGDQWDGNGLPDFALPDVDEPGTWQFRFARVGGTPVNLQWSEVSIVLHADPPTPPSLRIDPSWLAATLPLNGTQQLPLTLSNLGEEPLTWQLSPGSISAGLLRGPADGGHRPYTRPVNDLAQRLAHAAPSQGRPIAAHSFRLPDRGALLTHSVSMDVIAGNSLACVSDADQSTKATQVLRTFTLADFGITGAFNVADVTFGVEHLDGAGSAVAVNLYLLSGDLVYANLLPIGSATAWIEPQALTLVSVPVSAVVPPGSTLVVEVAAPDLPAGERFFIGSNRAGETAPSYIAASGCGLPEPVPATAGSSQMHVAMSVSGTVGDPDCALPTWLSLDETSGSIAAGGSQVLAVGLAAAVAGEGRHLAALCLDSNDPARPLVAVPVSLNVLLDPDDRIFRHGFDVE